MLGELEGSTEQAHCHRVSVNNKPAGMSTYLEKIEVLVNFEYPTDNPQMRFNIQIYVHFTWVEYGSNPRVKKYIYIWIRRVRLSSLDTTMALTMIQGSRACGCYKTLLYTNFTQSD